MVLVRLPVNFPLFFHLSSLPPMILCPSAADKIRLSASLVAVPVPPTDNYLHGCSLHLIEKNKEQVCERD